MAQASTTAGLNRPGRIIFVLTPLMQERGVDKGRIIKAAFSAQNDGLQNSFLQRFL
jgi:hypothetical protein